MIAKSSHIYSKSFTLPRQANLQPHLHEDTSMLHLLSNKTTGLITCRLLAAPIKVVSSIYIPCADEFGRPQQNHSHMFVLKPRPVLSLRTVSDVRKRDYPHDHSQ